MRFHEGLLTCGYQWIGLLGKIFTGNHGFYHQIEVFRSHFSLKPILWGYIHEYTKSLKYQNNMVNNMVNHLGIYWYIPIIDIPLWTKHLGNIEMNGNPTDWCGNMWEYTKSKTKKSLVLFLTHEMTRIKSLSISAASQTLALLLGEMWWTALWDHNWPYLASLGHKTWRTYGVSVWKIVYKWVGFSWIFMDFRWFSVMFVDFRWFSTSMFTSLPVWVTAGSSGGRFSRSSAIPLHDVSTKDQRATTGLPPAYHEFFFQDIT